MTYSCYMNTSYKFHFLYFSYFMPLTYGISYTYTGILTYSHIIHVFLFVDESTFLINWNHSNRIIQTQVMAFSCQLVSLPILPEGQFEILIFQCLDSMFGTGSLYSFEFKVLRVLFQLELPILEHQNSRYVRNNSDYSMIITNAGIVWHMTPL